MSLVLFLTNNCNLHCKYCFVNKNKEELSLENYIKTINIYKNVTENVTFFGGEPLLCFDRIKEIVKYNKDNNINVKYNLNTNALLLEGEILNYCLENNFLLNVSLDGNKESNLLNRCNEKDFNRILKNIKNSINRGGHVIVNYVITPNNIHLYSDGIKYLIKNNISEICLMIDYGAVWTKDDINKFREETNKVISLLIKNDNLTIYPLKSKINSIISKTEVKKCNFGKENLIVSTSGDYYPCMNFINDKKFKIDSINKEFKNTVNVTKCINCNYLKYCSNNCMCKSYKQNIKSEVDVNCEIEKILIKAATEYIIKKIDKELNVK